MTFPRLASRLLAALVIGHSAWVIPVEVRAADFDLATATIADIHAATDAGALSSEKLVSLYLARIAAYDQQGPSINSIITVNPQALTTARALDAERKTKGRRSALHGIPVVVKDLINTADLPTTGGFIALKGAIPARDAHVIAKLRAAGAISYANFTGWPDLIVPAGITKDGLPVTISFFGPAWSEPKLFGYGYDFEQAVKARVLPKHTPALPGDKFSY